MPIFSNLLFGLFSRCKIAKYCENRHRREDKERHSLECAVSQMAIKEPPVSEVEKEASKESEKASKTSEKVPYKVEEVEGKGRGLVATRTLEIGDLVLSEQFFLKLSKGSSSTTSSFSNLDAGVQAKLINLSSPADRYPLLHTHQLLQEKFFNNAVAFDKNEPDAVAVFETLSLINHSCKPNVVWLQTEEDKTRMEVRVCRRIQEGEEILASYASSIAGGFLLRDRRIIQLIPWGFSCRFSPMSFSPHSCLSF